MQTKRTIVILSVILSLSIILIYPAYADEKTESFTVYTEKQVYIEGEQVNIYVKANSIDPGQNITLTDVFVYDPENSIAIEWHNMSIVLTDTTQTEYVGTFFANTEGNYTIYAEATGCPWIIRCWWFFCWNRPPNHVVPESPFGTITAMAAMFGAFVLATARKRHNLLKHAR